MIGKKTVLETLISACKCLLTSDNSEIREEAEQRKRRLERELLASGASETCFSKKDQAENDDEN
jgi:hypothetical protein